MATRQELQERVEQLEEALEQAKDAIDDALSLENPDDDDSDSRARK